MINCIRKICAVFALGAAVIQAGAQEVSDHNISVWADMMQRGELRIGGNSAQGESDSNLAAFVIGRTRIGAAYKWKDRIEAHLTAQHSGTWGTGDGSLSVYEAARAFSSNLDVSLFHMTTNVSSGRTTGQ